ncbi:hypothetical protein [Candidatus Cardinium hertigii]|uniref:Porin n=1 Tax=Candidatus Cardinium hertigii TaxID=247481 RepID=A0A2Z3L9K1_9BACT|nr:hypothetical protein [Candidatus Cardinium hertigii]AWN82198.1 hypothetical protein DK880_00900 [Candidatus Cardinium hertigii]
MKLKIIVGGMLLWHGTTYTVYSKVTQKEIQQDNIELFDNEEDKSIMFEGKETGEKANEEEPFLLKLRGAVAMEPSMGVQGNSVKPANKVKVGLTLKADIPGILRNNQNVQVTTKLGFSTKEAKYTEIMVALGKYSLGYGTTFFAHKEGNPSLPVSVDGNTIQFKFEDALDCFRWGLAIEQPIAVKVGCFCINPKQQSNTFPKQQEKEDTKEEEEEQKAIQLDDDKKSSFKLKNDIPTLILKGGIVTDCFHVTLGLLGRLTNYTHSSSSDPKQKGLNSFQESWGCNLVAQYKKAKCTFTAQGVYVYGLGDYVTGLAAIQKDKEREEMCAFYYLDKDKKELKAIAAVGGGATLGWELTSKWDIQTAVTYLTVVNEDKQDKPAIAYKSQWAVVFPEITYKFSKHWAIAGSYSLDKELKKDKLKNEPIKHAFNSAIKFIL